MDCCFDNETLYAVFTQVIRYHYYHMHKVLEKIGAYPGQPPLLFIIGKQDGSSQKELADKLKVKAATITVMLKRMEKSGLVERRTDTDDQRISRVHLTEKGKELKTETLEAFKEIEKECFKNFTAEEQLLLRRLLMQMRDNLRFANNELSIDNT